MKGILVLPAVLITYFQEKQYFNLIEYKEEIIDLAIENNCIDIQENETGVTFEFQPSEFQKVDQLFRNSGFNLVNSEVAYLPSSYCKFRY